MTSIESKLEENAKGEIDNVRVAVRCRPLSENEISAGYTSAIEVDEVNGLISISEKHLRNATSGHSAHSRMFTFDTVFGINSKQLDIYTETARPIVNSVLEGYNGTIFAYGQTGTGKTYTMEGDRDVSELHGIIPNSFAHIFGHIAKAEGENQFLVRVSYLEIYNERIRDLLGKDASIAPEIKERTDIGVYVRNLVSYVVKTADDMDRIMTTGNRSRAVGKTKMNERSSRSHAIFTITVERSDLGADNKQHVRMGKLHLVDLAGSERVNKTGVTGDQFIEATKINLSLTTLGNVISALVDGKSTHIPYRNSKLTRLLQDSLGGNSKTVMIANIGPANFNIDETVNTLRYANRAKQIQNHARINEDPKDALLRQFQMEIAKLKKKLEEGSSSEVEGDGIIVHPQKKKKKLKRKVSDTILKLENELQAERDAFSAKKDMAEEEKQTVIQELEVKESELARAKKEQSNLEERLADLQSKVIVGGVNLLDKAEKQEKLLEESAKELKRRKEKESKLAKKLEETQAERLDIEEKYASLQEEAEGKTRKLKKLWNMVLMAKQELSDLKAENHQEIQELTDSVNQLNRELGLSNLILSFFVPEKYMRLIEDNSTWDESIGEWQIRAIEYAGNNVKREDPLAHIDYDEVYGVNTDKVYFSYADFDPDYEKKYGSSSSKNKHKSKTSKVPKSTSKEDKRKVNDPNLYPVSKSSSQVIQKHYA